MEFYTNCFSCGAKCLNIDGIRNRFLFADLGCYEMYNDVILKVKSDYRITSSLEYIIDTYYCQHPGSKEASILSNDLMIHLSGLYVLFELDIKPYWLEYYKLKFSKYLEEKEISLEIDFPSSYGDNTIYDVWENNCHRCHIVLAKCWALSTWKAWKPKSDGVIDITNRFLASTGFLQKVVNRY